MWPSWAFEGRVPSISRTTPRCRTSMSRRFAILMNGCFRRRWPELRQPAGATEDLYRHPAIAGRQGYRRDLDCGAQPLACARNDLGLPGRQRCLRGEASLLRYRRGPQNGAGCQQAPARCSGGNPPSQPAGHALGGGVSPLRQTRKDLHDQMRLLSAARGYRPQARLGRRRRACTTTCFADPLP